MCLKVKVKRISLDVPPTVLNVRNAHSFAEQFTRFHIEFMSDTYYTKKCCRPHLWPLSFQGNGRALTLSIAFVCRWNNNYLMHAIVYGSSARAAILLQYLSSRSEER